MDAMNIVYLPHPVSPELKAEYRAKKIKIIDARYAPAGYKAPVEAVEGVAEPTSVVEPPKKRGRRRKAD